MSDYADEIRGLLEQIDAVKLDNAKLEQEAAASSSNAAPSEKTVLVVGASGTVGQAVVQLFRESGYHVITAARTLKPGVDLQVDLSSVESVLALDKKIPGGVAHAIVCAGQSQFGSLDSFCEEKWNLNLSQKLRSTTQSALLLLNKMQLVRDGGSVTLTAGMAARIRNSKYVGLAVNNAGMEAFVKCAGLDLPRGLRLNALSPGLVSETAAKMAGAYSGLVKSSGPKVATVPAGVCAQKIMDICMHATMTAEVVDAAPIGEPATIGTLYGFPTSPYVRKVQMCVEVLGLADRVTVATILTTPLAPNPLLCGMNPLGKIPCLQVESGEAQGQHLYDSRVIVEYLQHVAGGSALLPSGAGRWTALRRQALADGVQDAMVLLRYEAGMREEQQRCVKWTAAQDLKLERGLQALDEECGSSIADGAVDIGTVSMACAVGYLQLRFPEKAGWEARYPKLAAWYAGFQTQQCFVKTVPPQQDPFELVKEAAKK
jgi:glutathione S-transferase/short-subunit dehydrogenase